MKLTLRRIDTLMKPLMGNLQTHGFHGMAHSHPSWKHSWGSGTSSKQKRLNIQFITVTYLVVKINFC